MREGGRKNQELRNIQIDINVVRYPPGSCIIEFGNTRVLCAASIEEKVPPFLLGKKSGWVTAEYSMLPWSTHTRTRRDIIQGRINGRSQEIQRLIGRCLRSVTNLKQLGERTIIVDCDVLQADGGTRTAAITGGFVALALACNKIRKKMGLETLPFTDTMAAISVGVVNGEVMADLCYSEDFRADVDMNVAMTGSGHIVEIQGTAEKTSFSRNELMQLTDFAALGIAQITEMQRTVLLQAGCPLP